jgi:cytochrome c biogenesis protein CcdA
MPLVQVARTNREWLKTVAILGLSSVLVTALFGVLLGAPGSLLAGTVGSRRTMSQIMQTALVGVGVLMIAVAMGELGLTRRLLPGLRLGLMSSEHDPAATSRGLYRQAAVVGASMAATFGICCTQPLYLALVVYVAVVGSVLYGALALGAYGLGLATSIALLGLILRPVGQAARFGTWMASHEDAFHLVQGLIFAVLGAVTVSFFWLRYTIPPV